MVVNHRNPPRWKCVKKFCMLKEVSWSKASFNTSSLDTRWAPTAFHHPHLRHHVQLLDLAGSTRWRHWWRWMRCLELSRIAAQLCRRFRGLSSQDFRHCSPHRQSENFCGLWIPHEPAALRLCEGVGAGPECTWSKQLHWSQHLFAGLMACEIPTCMKQRESSTAINRKKETTRLRGCRYSWNVSSAFGDHDSLLAGSLCQLNLFRAFGETLSRWAWLSRRVAFFSTQPSWLQILQKAVLFWAWVCGETHCLTLCSRQFLAGFQNCKDLRRLLARTAVGI